MKKDPSRWSKIFGSGPIGLLISLVLFFITYGLSWRIETPILADDSLLSYVIFFISLLMTAAVIVWSVMSLPASERGNRLVTRGAFRYVRHPLYAAFLSIFNFGLAVYLNSYLFIAWAVLLHPVWHVVVRYEEHLMVRLFGQDYVQYQQTTGRFFPRLRRLQAGRLSSGLH